VRISRTGLLVWTQLIKKERDDVEMREDDGSSMMTRTREGVGSTREYPFLFEGVVIALFVFGSPDVVVCSYQDRFKEGLRRDISCLRG
jgi:hypothetical protein